MSFRNNNADEAPTTSLYIPTVVDSTRCLEHHARQGEACYSAQGLHYNEVYGICNNRAKRAGMDGPINESSLVRKTSYRGPGG